MDPTRERRRPYPGMLLVGPRHLLVLVPHGLEHLEQGVPGAGLLHQSPTVSYLMSRLVTPLSSLLTLPAV